MLIMVAKPFYVASTKCIQITSTVHRSQAQNIDDCLKKVYLLLSVFFLYSDIFFRHFL